MRFSTWRRPTAPLIFPTKPWARELRDLNVSVPFLSNLDSRRDVKTEPKLAFKFNSSSFDSAAQSTPFAQSHKTDASIRLTGVDLKPCLGYVPANVPVRLMSAVLNADIKMAFEQVTRPGIKLSGVVDARGVKVADLRRQELLAFEGLKVTLGDVRPLEQLVKISLLELSAPTLEVSRDRAGNINPQLQPPNSAANANANASSTSNTAKLVAINADPTRATASFYAKKEPWKLEAGNCQSDRARAARFPRNLRSTGSRLSCPWLSNCSRWTIWPCCTSRPKTPRLRPLWRPSGSSKSPMRGLRRDRKSVV